jgi:hypothetical protein
MKKLLAISSLLLAASASCIAQIPIAQTVSFGLNSGTGGSFNSFFGYGAGYGTYGDQNTFIGYNAGLNTTAGSQNTFLGYKAGLSNNASVQNHFIGYQSGYSNNVGYLNHFEGYNSGYSNTAGSENQFIGLNAGYSNSNGGTNLFIGINAGRENTIASNNHFVGQRAGLKNTTGSNNYFSGFQTGYNNISGSNNHYSGFQAGYSNVMGSGNVFLGFRAGYFETGSNKLYLDNSDTNSPLIQGDFGSDILTVNGKLGIGTGTPRGSLDVAGLGDVYLTGDPYGNAGQSAYLPGHLYIAPYHNATDWSYIQARRPNTSGTTNLRFRTCNASTLTEAMSILGNGSVGIGTINPTYLLQVQNAYCDGNTWYNVSDKNMKENFARIKQDESILDKVMELPIQYWNYKTDKANRHIGPTAQDFYKVFQLGVNEKAISTIDESGIALAAIQELNTQTQQLKQLLGEQQQLIASLLQAKVESSDNATVDESGLKLHQNQPNPFQRDTKITMDIPQNIRQATLYVYDLQGKTVGQQTVPGRGNTSVTIEAGKMTSGVYLYMLIGDGKATGVKRMILTE